MHYKLYIDESYDDSVFEEIFERLVEIVKANDNIDFKKYPEPFMQVDNSVILLNSMWGAKRPEVYDVEELSAEYPEITFYLMQISNVINDKHFEQLGNYSLSEYKNGGLVKVSKPQPVQWETVREYRRLNPWG